MTNTEKIMTLALAVGVIIFVADQYKKSRDGESFVIESTQELEEPMKRPPNQMQTRPVQIAA